MSTDDQFTSIQWDREEVQANEPSDTQHQETINEDDEDKEINNKEEGEQTEHEEQEDELGIESGNDVILHERSSDVSIEQRPSVAKDTNEEDVNKDAENTKYSAGDDQRYYIHVSVSQPLRDLDTSSKPYISYLITTVTNDPAVVKLSSAEPDGRKEEIDIKTRRRYGDFRFLHDCLSNDYPQVMIPPLPSKLNFKYLTGDTFSSSFVNKRLHSLNRFIQFISEHKLLSKLSVFHLFLSDFSDWNTFQKNLKISKGGIQEHGDTSNSSTITSNVVNKVVNEELTETIMNFLTPAKHKRETNKDILEISDKLRKLYENLVNLDKLFSRLNKKNYDLSHDYKQFLQQMLKLATIEKSPTEENDQSSTIDDIAVEENFAGSFKVFAESLMFFLENWSQLHDYIDESFLVSIKDCAKYIVSLTNLIELQHNKRIDLQVLQDYLTKAKGELATTSPAQNGPPSPVKVNAGGIVSNTTQLIKDTLSTSATSHIASASTDSKTAKLQAKIAQLEAEITTQTKVVQDLTNRIINEEYPNWDVFNKKELKLSLLGLCDEQITFYRSLVDNWNDAELKLMKRLEELN